MDALPDPNKRDGWSNCICQSCNRLFFQKSTLLKALERSFEKWKDLPLNIELISIKKDGFMTVNLTITQTDEITENMINKEK